MSLFEELKRRNVIKVGAAYVVVAWITVQVASIALPAFEAPSWVLRVFILLVALGLPLALVLSWLFEVTPQGMKVEPAPFGNKRLFAIATGLAALAIGWYFVGQPALRPGTIATATPAPAAAKGPPRRSIAVLPFVDMSQGKDQEYFSDGITEEILNALTRIEGLKVAGRTSSFQFKGRNESLQAIGAALGVAHVLEGSVRKQGDRIRITAQLIKVDDGFHVWSQNYDRKLDDIFAVQDEISGAIAAALKSRLAPGAQTPATVDPGTYDLYLQARQALARRTGADITQSIALFTTVTERDPAYADAWSGLAKASALRFNYAGGNAHADAPRTREAAERALALDPANAEALSMRALLDSYLEWNAASATRDIAAAVEAAPNDAEVANFAGDTFRFLGDLEQSEAWERRAVELDPLFDVNHSDLAWILMMRHRYREALVPAARAVQIDPTYPSVHDVRARTYLWLGDRAHAAAEADELARLDPTSATVVELRARLAIAAGDVAQARQHLATLQARAESGETLGYVIATLQALLGDHDDAARSLERAFAARDPTFAADTEFVLPEDWPDHPGIRAVFARPELAAIIAERRRTRLAKAPAP